jgi:uncharacterized repeat protein (TIGR01451 family)
LMDGARGDEDLTADGTFHSVGGPGRFTGTDLAVQQVADPDPVGREQTYTYRLTVSNLGPFAATGILLTDTLPEGVTFVDAEAGTGAFQVNGNEVTFALGTLAASETATISLLVRAPSVATVVSNVATVRANEADYRVGNNTSTADTLVKNTGFITGQKFEDMDGDGHRDPGEVGLNGYPIQLVDEATGVVLMTTRTWLGARSSCASRCCQDSSRLSPAALA